MRRRHVLAALLLGSFAVPAQATLFDRGNGMIYDDVLNATWLQDANLGGSMTWYRSVAWADQLVYGGFDDWRLASMDVNMDDVIVDCSAASQADCRDNELGYMFYYNLGGMFGDDLSGSPTSVDGITFSNVGTLHWSGTEGRPLDAWFFSFRFGFQDDMDQGFSFPAWAVRSGDVAVVPLPAGVWLLASGLLGLAGLRGGKRRR